MTDNQADQPSEAGGSSALSRAGLEGGVSLPVLDGGKGRHTTHIRKLTGRQESSADLPAGELLSNYSGERKYEVNETIALGGMGKVLRVFDRDIRRTVAMKTLSLDAHEENRARFVEEAQVTGQLEHPNIVPVHELGVDAQGRLFFTMQLVRGHTLRDRLDAMLADPGLDKGTFRLRVLVTSLVQVCKAIAYAHGRGVVHRDLKPDNVMLGDDGAVQVMDWGLARVGAKNIGSPSGEKVGSYRHDRGIYSTHYGTVAGTPAYMSPEQARGAVDEIDERSDIYAIGVMLYEILTLHLPIEAASEEEFIEKVKAGQIAEPCKYSARRRFPPRLGEVAMKALSFDPGARYQSADDLRFDLEKCLDLHTLETIEEPFTTAAWRLACRYPGWAAAILAGLVALSAGWWL